ncbi:MAG: TetR/AcrR family transcriptional regulator [Clostridia bacterium]|nr:TetR/AcrR family transcriptional regulator [Clostridia bacterium]
MEFAALNRRESLILTAIEIINELGVQGLSVREVAKRQSMSNAAIFNHFKTKSDLVHAVLDHYSQYDSAIIQSIRLKGLKSKDAIKYYVDSFYTYYENYPAITAIVQSYEVLRCEPEFSEKVKKLFFSRSTDINQMVEEAQASGQLRSDIDSECITDTILGTCRSLCLKWRMNDFGFPLKERVLYTLNSILDSFSQK